MPSLLTKLMWEEVANSLGKTDLSIQSSELRQASSSRYRTFWKTTASPLGAGKEQTIASVLGRKTTAKKEEKSEAS